SDEHPVEAVTLEPFFISKYEMTQAQWLRLTGSNPSWFSETGFAGERGPTNPVETVSWFESSRVAERIGLRLPTEAQWGEAARGGSTSTWWTGDDRARVRKAGNVADASLSDSGFTVEPWSDGFDTVAPVGKFAANGFGLFDVIGNVWEWCEDELLEYADAPS